MAIYATRQQLMRNHLLSNLIASDNYVHVLTLAKMSAKLALVAAILKPTARTIFTSIHISCLVSKLK